MKFSIYVILWSCCLFSACKLVHSDRSLPPNKSFGLVLQDYYIDRMRYFPLEATQNGDTAYNDQLPIDFTDSYMDTLRHFYARYLDKMLVFDRDKFNQNDAVSYDIFIREMKMNLEGLGMHLAINNVTMPNLQYIPFNQFEGIPLFLGQMGSGGGIQPFTTTRDYKNWIKRAAGFQAWTDSAIVYFRKGLQNGYILPRCLVEKMIPEMLTLAEPDFTKSIYYMPLRQMPVSFSSEEKANLSDEVSRLILEILAPSYKKLANFLQEEYLPKSRSNIGLGELPNGTKLYDYLLRYWTTTHKSPEEIYQTGLSEVKRIRKEMEAAKSQTGFIGDLATLFLYMKNDSRFMPYKTPEEVLTAFRKIQFTIEPNLVKYFGLTPKTKFEIRQTEAFRAASANAEYIPGDPESKRPGVFYIPIMDATRFNTCSGMESLFLHEAIPGHYFQNSLQMQDSMIPKFRRFIWYGAYGEGWALYAESLGKELGLYTDPYQYMAALGNEMHRAVRLVVDVALHLKKMTRQEAIRYMLDNEAISDQRAIEETERYIAIPAQALSYKTGELLIRALRIRFSKELGTGFHVSAFHDEVLKDGSMPLDVFEQKMESWEMIQ